MTRHWALLRANSFVSRRIVVSERLRGLESRTTTERIEVLLVDQVSSNQVGADRAAVHALIPLLLNDLIGLSFSVQERRAIVLNLFDALVGILVSLGAILLLLLLLRTPELRL